MARLIAAAAPAAPLWTSFESAMRRTFQSITAPAVDPAAVAAIEGEQARLRQSSRLWLVG